jgi:paraquat-inducible protein B
MMDRADLVLQHTDAAVSDGPAVYELTRTLQEVSAAARSVRQLTGYLQRNPSAAVFGRPVAREK